MEGFKINEDFAKKYNKYRQKEELQKLKSRYGDASLQSDSSESESEDENAEAVTPGLERDFLRTLAYLKKRDPAIYDKSKKFYEEAEDSESDSSTEIIKEKKTKPMFLKDYERKVVLENEGKFLEDASDDEEQRETREASPSYYEEQAQLKENIKKAIMSSVDENDNNTDELLTRRTKSFNEKEKENEEFRKWLKTPEAKLDLVAPAVDDSKIPNSQGKLIVQDEVAPLKQYWTDPGLDEGEKFLRDYILERKYLDPDDNGEIPTYDDIIGQKSDDDISDTEDELFEKKSETFEHKYNFRFQDPDQEFIKSYPRTIGSSVRRKEDKRKKKRDEKKLKDEEKKKKKQEELKELKRLKKNEILDKINKLQETTGNTDMAFSETDLEVDFDPDQYDKRMQEIFEKYDEDYEEEKPVFSDLEDEMEDYERYWEEDQPYNEGEYGADCEDPDFIMDCDYDATEHQMLKDQRKARKSKNQNPNALEKDKKSKKSVFFDSVSKPKPTFDPNEKSFEKYLDEYYALDYEDLIGDLPCRFKYRQVVPNDFGLSTDEILSANDKELNAWCSLRRTVQYRKEDDERMDVKKYKRKGNNIWKKARVLQSVYKMPGEDKDLEEEKVQESQTPDGDDDKNNQEPMKRKKMNSRKRRRLKERAEKLRLLMDDGPGTSAQLFENSGKINQSQNELKNGTASKAKNIKKKPDRTYDRVAKISDDRLKAYGLQPKKFLKKIKYGTNNKGNLQS